MSQTVSTSGSGLVFVNTYTANDSQQYINCIVAAETAFENLWTNPVTINLTFDEQAAGISGNLATNTWSGWVNVTYTQLQNALPASDALPATDPTGGHTWSLPEAYARMLGLTTSAPSTDATITLNVSYGWSFGQDVVNTIEHEISEGAMGRVGGLGDQNSAWSTMDLFRYASSGAPDYTDGRDGITTYFSMGGELPSSLSFNNEYSSNGMKNNGGDTADFTQSDVFGTGYPGETNTLSQTDIAVMDALGWKQTTTRTAPTLAGQSFSVFPSQSVSIAADISVSNPSGDGISSYWVEDLGGGHGHLVVSGAAAPDGQWIEVSSGWSNAQYAGGASIGTDTLEVSMLDALTGNFVYSSPFGASTNTARVLQGSAPQYVIADNAGSLYIQDSVSGRDGTQTLPGVTEMVFTDGVGVFDPTGTAEDVARLYGAALDRAPDVAGLESWTAMIDDGSVPLSQVATDFAASPEFISKYGSLSNAAFVNQLYENVLGRAPDAPGAQAWNNALSSGVSRGSVIIGFAESAEYEARTVSTAGDVDNAEIYRLYQTAFDRTPDAAGLAYWSSILASGASPTQVAQGFVKSAEFQREYGAMSVGDFVSATYQNALHRSPDAAGYQSWISALEGGTSEASVVVGLSDSLESRARTASATHANWVFVPT
ncbi:MAG TPA: DUF4214 domain-containing protein [Rhodopila sp.]